MIQTNLVGGHGQNEVRNGIRYRGVAAAETLEKRLVTTTADYRFTPNDRV